MSSPAPGDLLRGQITFASGLGSDAPPLPLKTAKRVEPLDPDLAHETYLSAWIAAMFAGRLAAAGDLAEVSSAARALPAPAHPPRLVELAGRPGAAGHRGPVCRSTDAAPGSKRLRQQRHLPEEDLRWGWLAQAAAIVLWDEDGWHAIAVQQTQLARDVGALDQLPIDLASEAATVIRSGDFPAGTSLIAEAEVVSEATGIGYPPFATLWLTCLSARKPRPPC